MDIALLKGSHRSPPPMFWKSFVGVILFWLLLCVQGVKWGLNSLNPHPSGVEGQQAAVCDTTILVYGGTREYWVPDSYGSGEQAPPTSFFTDFSYYDIRTRVWKKLKATAVAPDQDPGPLVRGNLACIRNTLLLAGGTNNRYRKAEGQRGVTSVFVLHLDELKWRRTGGFHVNNGPETWRRWNNRFENDVIYGAWAVVAGERIVYLLGEGDTAFIHSHVGHVVRTLEAYIENKGEFLHLMDSLGGVSNNTDFLWEPPLSGSVLPVSYCHGSNCTALAMAIPSYDNHLSRWRYPCQSLFFPSYHQPRKLKLPPVLVDDTLQRIRQVALRRRAIR